MTVTKLKPYSEGLVSVELRKESTADLIYRATTEETLTDGFFFIYDWRNNFVGTMRPESIWVLSFVLHSYPAGTSLESFSIFGDGTGTQTTGEMEARIQYKFGWNEFLSSEPIDINVAIGKRAIEEANKRGSTSAASLSCGLPTGGCIEDDHDYYDNYYAALGDGGIPQSVEQFIQDAETLTTRPPVWNTEVKAYLSNFGSRVKIHDPFTNFILIANNSSFEDSHEAVHVMIRFGKVLKGKWILDFRSGGRFLTPMVAFATALSALVRKPLLGNF